MKKILLFSFLIFTSLQSVAALKYTKTYVKKNGTTVQAHYSTNSNKNKLDNYSTKGNFNPFTGKKGSVNPYKY